MDLRFNMPVEVIMNEGCVRKEMDRIASFGTRAIIVSDAISAASSGAMADVISVFEDKGIEYLVFDRVQSNPTAESAREAARIAKEFKAQFVFAIGGGSSMDVGKAVTLLVKQETDLSDEDMLSGNFINETIPLIAIPTTSGTGSEVTPFAMLTSYAANRKINLHSSSMYANLALLDPRYTMTVPYIVTVNTMLDALSHAMESLLTVSGTPILRAIAKESLANAGAIIRGLLKDREISLELRELMMYDSVTAGMVVGQTRTSILHGLSYSLTVHRHLAHGRAIGLLMIPCLKFNASKRPDLVKEITDAMGIDGLDELEKSLNMLLGEKESFTEDEIALWADEAATLHNVNNSIVVPTRNDIVEILREV